MPDLPPPPPLTVVVDLPVGSRLHVIADDRDDVLVTALPADATKPGDVRAAEEVHVERAADAVTISGPRAWKQYVPFTAGSLTVTVELPSGSNISGKAGTLNAEGRLGSVDVTLTAGDARVDEAGRLELKVAAGSVVVGRTTGATSVKAGAGSVRITELAGDGTVRASNGTTTIGIVTGSLHVTGAHGDIVVGRVRGTLTVKTASAGIRVDSVESGTVTLATSYGSIEVGVPTGTAAWLDVSSQHGSARSQLRPAEGPIDDEAIAEIHASTSYGDILVRRP